MQLFKIDAIKEVVESLRQAWDYYNKCLPHPKPRKQQQPTHEVWYPSKDKNVPTGAIGTVNKGLDVVASGVLRQLKYYIFGVPIIFIISEITTRIW